VEFFGELTAVVGSGLVSGASVAGAAGWLFKKWMGDREQTEKKLSTKIDKLSDQIAAAQIEGKECSILFHQIFRTKADAEKAWMQARAEWDDQWSKINDHDRRLTKLETICEREHQKSHGEARS
jgi:hypothetical protein